MFLAAYWLPSAQPSLIHGYAATFGPFFVATPLRYLHQLERLTVTSTSFVMRTGRTSRSSSGTRAPTTANGTPRTRSPRSRSVTTERRAGSSRGITQHLWEQQRGGLESLSGSAVPKFGVHEQVWCRGLAVGVRRRNR